MEGGTAPSSPAAGPPPPPPPVVYPWYQAPPEKRDSKLAIIIVIVVVVAIVVPVVLAAVLYVMVSGLVGPNVPIVPTFALTPATSCGTGCFDVRVASAEGAAGLGRFRVLLMLPDLRELTGPLQEGTVLSDGGMFLNFTDRAVAGLLDASDRFRLENALLGGRYELILIWAPSGALVATVTWVA